MKGDFDYIRQPPKANGQKPTANRQPPTAKSQKPKANDHSPTILAEISLYLLKILKPMITSLDQLDPSGVYTYADYLRWRLEERIELIRGKILQMSPAPSRRHQEISMNLTQVILPAFKNRPCKLFAAPFDVRLPKKKTEEVKDAYTVVQPDLCVVCDLEKLDEQGCEGAPDLIIEILSPGNSRREMRDKYEVYEESGVREYWLVRPEDKSVQVFLLDEEKGKFYGIQPFVDGDRMPSHVFPDLKVDLSEVFAE